MQRICEIESRAQVGEGALDGGPVFDLIVGQREQVLEGAQNVPASQSVRAAQHPLQFQQHGLGNKQVAAALDRAAGRLALGAGAAMRFSLKRIYLRPLLMERAITFSRSRITNPR